MKRRILIMSDTHYCQKEWYGISNDERAARLIRDINEEHESVPFDLILHLGDFSLDFWEWETLGTYIGEGRSYTDEFMTRYATGLPDVPRFFLPGNHEQYSDGDWLKIAKNHREGYVISEDVIFYMRDSFGGNLNPDFHSDGTYTPLDADKIFRVLEENPDKKVIICCHIFNLELESENEGAKRLLSDERVICIFAGHNHSSHAEKLPPEFGSKMLIFDGNYSYANKARHPAPHYWGFRELYIDDGGLVTNYVIPENDMTVDGEKIHVARTTREAVSISF